MIYKLNIMKKIVLALGVFIFILSGCGPSMTPEQYNDLIIGEQTKIMGIMLDMFDDIEATEFKKSELTRQELVKQCDASIKIVGDLPDYKGNTELRDAAKTLFTFYKEVSDKEYKEMLDILQKDSIEVEDILRITELETALATREEAMDARFQAAQESFATEHNLVLTKNNMQDDIDKLGQ